MSENISMACPHCRVVVNYRIFNSNIALSGIENLLDELEKYMERTRNNYHLNSDTETLIKDKFIGSIKNLINLENNKELNRIDIDTCPSCKKIIVWLDNEVIYPKPVLTPPPNEDLPQDIKDDYDEAAKILQDSPRGSCALLRPALQKLLLSIGQDRNLDRAIQDLNEGNAIDDDIQKAMDSVRIAGNNSIHPNKLDIDLKDNKELAIQLFKIINYIANYILTKRREIEEMANKLQISSRTIKR